ncbi:hypothetical protein HX089_11630 [Myroides odoratimimus]|nr:hypothetical protein [Myroides odoratimimus]MDM1517036.1 hypothetical protein [Myroides odoratimimus]MDM1536783.1 hypothetical protein [Myroides odoratimimus]MDM1676238.1 hypothetical protein [Myroides odoratimimus]
MALDGHHKKIVSRGIFSSLPMLIGLSVLFIIAEGKGVFLIPFIAIIMFIVFTVTYLVVLVLKYFFFNKVTDQNDVDSKGFYVYLLITAILACVLNVLFMA